jgi:hypothetical protein
MDRPPELDKVITMMQNPFYAAGFLECQRLMVGGAAVARLWLGRNRAGAEM